MGIIIICVMSGNDRPPAARPGLSMPGGVRRVCSRDLLGTQRELVITHQSREYRLRITQNGKLILTA
jgi:hemin uptake protein HemP